MNVINPALTAAQSLQPQQNQLNAKPELKLDDKSAGQATNGGNSTVTLSEAARSVNGQEDLSASQTVRNAADTESKQTEANQTSAGLAEASNNQDKLKAYTSIATMEG